MPRYCFNLARRIMTDSSEDLSDISANESFIRRRMGVSSAGVRVPLNILGEPINLAGDIYNDLPFEGSLRKQKLSQFGSAIGGVPNNETKADKEKIEVYFSPSLDIRKGDLIKRLLNPEEIWFKVVEINSTTGGTFTYLTAYTETRSTK